MSSLADVLREMIASDGPMPLDRFMALANSHPTMGYYATRDPFGAAGDFTTAPEISQMFGELLGLWAAEAWRACGTPDPCRLVELGPGRGTMIADALRALRVAPDCFAALDVHLVETSPLLAARQQETLAACGKRIAWHDTIDTLPRGPAIILANEFFDALPVKHFVRDRVGWHERRVGLDDAGAFVWGVEPAVTENVRGEARSGDASNGALIEISVAAQDAMTVLAHRIAREGGALLAIDYGYTTTRTGETLQAMCRHRFVDPLETPGEADLTVHVDFAALARTALAAGARVQGPVTQAFFLQQLGIEARAARLARDAASAQADAIAAARDRLTATSLPTDMGALFKVLAVVHDGTPPLPGFLEDT